MLIDESRDIKNTILLPRLVAFLDLLDLQK